MSVRMATLETVLAGDVLVAYLVSESGVTLGGPVLAGVNGDSLTLPQPIIARTEGAATVRWYNRKGMIADSGHLLPVAAGSTVSMG